MLIQNISGKIKGDSIYEEASKQFEVFIPGESGAATVLGNYTPMDMGAKDNSMQTLHDRLASGHTDSSQGHSQYSEQLANMRASLSSLRDVNKEVFGWIYVPDTKINYPILKGKDNDYYLDHGFDHQVLAAGAVFADCTNHPKVTENQNLVLYGHNVKNGAMFHQLNKFLQEDFFMNTTVELATFDGIYTFEVFAAYRTHIKYRYYATNFPTDEAFVEFCYEAERKSLYHKEGIEFDADDTILTLSTCVNGEKNYRYAIQAKLVSIER
jgi:sortase B